MQSDPDVRAAMIEHRLFIAAARDFANAGEGAFRPGYWEYVDLLEAAAALSQSFPASEWHFIRFVNGVEMAEGIGITKAATDAEAISAAVRLCPQAPNTVLVLKSPTFARETAAPIDSISESE